MHVRNLSPISHHTTGVYGFHPSALWRLCVNTSCPSAWRTISAASTSRPDPNPFDNVSRVRLACRVMPAETPTPISPSTTRLGWIGTGVMGLSMCGHLLGKRPTPSPSTTGTKTHRAQLLLDKGATYGPIHHRAVAAQSDVIFTMVGYPCGMCAKRTSATMACSLTEDRHASLST